MPQHLLLRLKLEWREIIKKLRWIVSLLQLLRLVLFNGINRLLHLIKKLRLRLKGWRLESHGKAGLIS
ncbi:hypothetical protein D7Y53_23710 [Stenotrophomonas maltophilia]|nr:hypothetical protein [Stenotrophomonas maltophilia]PJL44202.1 hypothetical protein B9Y56_05745 [Stenotrophomonas maltophilia]